MKPVVDVSSFNSEWEAEEYAATWCIIFAITLNPKRSMTLGHSWPKSEGKKQIDAIVGFSVS